MLSKWVPSFQKLFDTFSIGTESIGYFDGAFPMIVDLINVGYITQYLLGEVVSH